MAAGALSDVGSRAADREGSSLRGVRFGALGPSPCCESSSVDSPRSPGITRPR